MSAPQSPQSPPWLPISTKLISIYSQVENPEQFNLAVFLSQEGLFLLSRSPTPNVDVDDIDEYDEEADLFCEDDYLTDPESKPKSEPKLELKLQPE
ncbi:hypothetical protein FQN51_003493 [Onygenales sp. PD_10]|nr:hypothetical protein FQN51_003493 [Onygenales sp. PD_10]